MEALIGVYKFLRGLSFGAVLFAGIGFLIYQLLPVSVIEIVSVQYFMAYCAALGAGLHTVFSGIFQRVLPPFFAFLVYYENLVELRLLIRNEVISIERGNEICNQLTDKRFLGLPSKPIKTTVAASRSRAKNLLDS